MAANPAPTPSVDLITAAALIYPLRFNADELSRQLRRFTPGRKPGQVLVGTIRTLERAEKLARELTPFDPTGL